MNTWTLDAVVEDLPAKQGRKGEYHMVRVAWGEHEAEFFPPKGQTPRIGDAVRLSGTVSAYNGYPKLSLDTIETMEAPPAPTVTKKSNNPPPGGFDDDLPF